MPVSKQIFFEKLPQEQSTTTTNRQVLALFAGLLVSFLIINFAMRVYLQKYTPNFGFWLIDQKWSLLLELREPKDVLVLGDSAANQAVIPELIQTETGLTAMNLATVANLTFLNDVWMLRQYLTMYEPPRAIVIVHTYEMWHRSLHPQTFLRVPFGQIEEDAILLPAPTFPVAEYLQDRALFYLPAYAQGESLRSLIRTVLQIPPGFSLFQVPYTLSPTGYFAVTEHNPTIAAEDIADHIEFLQEARPFVSPENADGLSAIKELAEQHNLDVYLLHAPVAADIANTELFKRYFQVIDDYLQEATADSSNVHHVLGIASFPSEMMESADHVLVPAAERFTLDWVLPIVSDLQD